MSDYCRYIIFDIATKKVCVTGEKQKDMLSSRFKENIRFISKNGIFRKIYELACVKTICNRDFLFIYYFDLKHKATKGNRNTTRYGEYLGFGKSKFEPKTNIFTDKILEFIFDSVYDKFI